MTIQPSNAWKVLHVEQRRVRVLLQLQCVPEKVHPEELLLILVPVVHVEQNLRCVQAPEVLHVQRFLQVPVQLVGLQPIVAVVLRVQQPEELRLQVTHPPVGVLHQEFLLLEVALQGLVEVVCQGPAVLQGPVVEVFPDPVALHVGAGNR